MRLEGRLFSRWWPALASLALLLAAAGAVAVLSVRQNDGVFAYALDDAYIHMAVAKNLALHGVWGLTRHHFTSCVSSLAWPLLLSGVYAVGGVRVAAPLALNLLFAALVLAFAAGAVRERVGRGPAFLLALRLLLFTPLVTIVFGGMEHTMHVLATLMTAHQAARMLSSETASARDRLALGALAAWLAASRYEGAFLAGLVAVLFVLRGRFATGVLAAAMAAAPIAAYGLVSRAHGWFFLPNSLLIKGTDPLRSGLAEPFVMLGRQWVETPHLWTLLLLGLLLWRAPASRGSPWRYDRVAYVLFAGATLAHLALARVGWLYRYEAYLVALGVFVTAPAAIEFLSGAAAANRWWRAAVSAAALAAACVLTFRGVEALIRTPRAMRDRYLEHVWPARFVAEYYPAGPVAANDVGALAFYTDAEILDVYGLGSIEPILRRNEPGGYDSGDVRAWTRERGAKIAILQVEWSEVTDRAPPEWIEVGEWWIPRNVVFGDRTVGFFGTDAESAERLKANLRAFSKRLPRDLWQVGPYLEPGAGPVEFREL